MYSKTSAAGNDFVVIHNPTSKPVDIAGWKLQYRSATASGKDAWITKKTFGCEATDKDCTTIIAPQGNIVAGTYAISGIFVHSFASGFSDEGGQIRLAKMVSEQLQSVDVVGYGTAVVAETQAAPAPRASKAIVRKSDAKGQLIDSDNNKNDFIESCVELKVRAIHKAAECPKPDSPPEVPDDGEVVPDYAVLDITELLPNPASPLTDGNHEFIELYNPNNHEVALKGYSIQAGTDFKYKYTFEDGVIASGAYLAVFSADSDLNLANSGSQVRLLDPSGKTVAAVTPYENAKPGNAWIKSESSWLWSLQATPGAVNVLEVEQPPIAAATVKKTTPAKPVVKKTATSVAKAVKAATTTKTTKPPEPAKTTATIPAQKDPFNFNYLLLAVVGLAVVSYVCYEYRHELVKLWHKIRGMSVSSGAKH